MATARRSGDHEGAADRSGGAAYERAPVPGVEADLMQWLPAEIRDEMAALAIRRHIGAGAFVFQHGDAGRAMYRVLHGSVRLSLMRADGQQMIYALLGPGECVAASSIIDNHPLPQTAEALDDVQLQVLSAAAFDELRKRHRAFDDALLHLFARRIRTLSVHVGTLRLAGLPVQIALRLLELARPDGAGRLLAPVTHADLAMFVSVSRQSVHRVLKAMVAEGLVRLHYGAIELLDFDRLKVKADFL